MYRILDRYVLVKRVAKLYPPREILAAFEIPGIRKWMPLIKPLSTHRSPRSRGPQYHKRRIRYFVDRLRKGYELPQIEITSEGHAGDTYLLLQDGHHRFLAYHYLKRERMPISYDGSNDAMLKYLTGERNTPP